MPVVVRRSHVCWIHFGLNVPWLTPNKVLNELDRSQESVIGCVRRTFQKLKIPALMLSEQIVSSLELLTLNNTGWSPQFHAAGGHQLRHKSPTAANHMRTPAATRVDCYSSVLSCLTMRDSFEAH